LKVNYQSRKRIFLGWDEALQENVNPLSDAKEHHYDAINTRLAIYAANEVGKIVENTQVMLDIEDINRRFNVFL